MGGSGGLDFLPCFYNLNHFNLDMAISHHRRVTLIERHRSVSTCPPSVDGDYVFCDNAARGERRQFSKIEEIDIDGLWPRLRVNFFDGVAQEEKLIEITRIGIIGMRSLVGAKVVPIYQPTVNSETPWTGATRSGLPINTDRSCALHE
jgi:hypothetical protein